MWIELRPLSHAVVRLLSEYNDSRHNTVIYVAVNFLEWRT